MNGKRILFIDRDGTLIVEPESDRQVDSFEKLAFLPGVISALRNICQFLDYQLVMVTNQDGLGTESFPEDRFWPVHNLMLEVLAGEGVVFGEVLIDRTFAEENKPTRKPGTALVSRYMEPEFDLKSSVVIGDRATDVEFAKNLGALSVRLADQYDSSADLTAHSWEEIYNFLRKINRSSCIERVTNETRIKAELSLDGGGQGQIKTGLGFFDHMLEQLARHSGCTLDLSAQGDLAIDEHHTIEDTAIVLGQAVREAIGDKRGISRYGFTLPMDDALAQVAIDLSDRPWLVWKAEFKREKIGDMPTEMFYHFFKSFSDSARCTVNIKAEGINEHHKIEAIFKAFARALRQCWQVDLGSNTLPTTKGML